MGIIASWLNDRVQAKEVDLIVEDTLQLLKQRDGLLEPFFPLKTYNTRDFMGYVVEKIRTLASVVAVGAKIPAKKHGNLRELSTQLVKIGDRFEYDEKLQWEMHTMQELARARGTAVQDMYTTDGDVLPGVNQTLVDYIYGKPQDLVTSIIDTLSFMTWQVATVGEIDYSDNRTGTRTTLSWRDPDADYDHFPAALSANPSGAGTDPGTVVWTNYDWADGIRRLQDDAETFHETGGCDPDVTVMSKIDRKHLMRQKAVIEKASSITSTPMDASRMSPKILNSICEAYEIPPIVVYDEQYQIQDASGNVTKGRFMPVGRFCFLKEDMGERAMGITMESMQGGDGIPKGGIFMRTFEERKSPVLDVTEAIATALPICLNPKKLFSRQTYTP